MTKHTDKVFLIILFGIIIIQTTLIPQLAFLNITPNLAAVFLIALAIAGKMKSIFEITFLVGLILDTLSGLPFGTITVGLILAVFAVNSLSFKFLKNPDILALALIAFSGAAVYNLTLFTLANIGGLSIVLEDAGQIFSMISLKILVELVLVLAFYGFILKLND